MKQCRCGEQLVTLEQVRRGWCSVKCQQAHTPRATTTDTARPNASGVNPVTVNRRTPDANTRDHR